MAGETETPWEGPTPEPRSPVEPAPESALVLLLNHRRDPLDELAEALAQAGFKVRQADSLAETRRILDELRPDAVVLSPLVLKEGGVELELIESLQRDEDPVPVILLLEDLAGFAQARRSKVVFRDFLMKPYAPAECVHRVELALHNRSRFRRLHERTRYLEGQVSVDFKTGLLSEQYFRRILALEFKRAQRHGNPLSLLLIDIDDFKRVNDRTEYAFGDEVLRRVGESLKQNLRETDFAARLGGDEFTALLPQTTSAEAVQTALRIRQRISGMTVQKGDYSCQVTVSIGLDSYDGRSAATVEHLVRNANKALQEVKRRGKNKVWLYTEQQAEA